MKKNLVVLGSILLAFAAACSVEPEQNEMENNVVANLAAPTFDESNVGIYKGIFTTLNSKYRGTLEVRIPQAASLSSQNIYPTAKLTLHTGKVVELKSTQIYEDGQGIEEMIFEGGKARFSFSVEGNGAQPTIADVSYLNMEAAITVAKETSFGPVATVTGTYECEICGFIDGSGEQSFNFMTVTGSDAVSTQTVFGATNLNGVGYQNNCSAGSLLTLCDIQSGVDGGTDVGFTGATGGDVTWSGRHLYSSTGTDFSAMSGTWEWASPNSGVISGSWKTDGIATTLDDNIDVFSFSEDFNTFRGDGFVPNPVAGQLDSDIFIVTGVEGTDLTYGASDTNGKHSRGDSTGNVANNNGGSGIYAFDFTGSTTDYALGVQARGNTFTPGTIEVRIQNTSASALEFFSIDYNVLALNNENRGMEIDFSYSTDGTNFTTEPSMYFTSPAGQDNPAILYTGTRSLLIRVGTPVAVNDYLYLRFSGDQNGGTNARDEIAIDNILVRGVGN